MVKDRLGDPVIIGNKPQVAVWGSGIRVFEELYEVDTNYRGLKSRKFKIKRRGSGLDTKYSIAPADVDSGSQPFTAEEKELAKTKYDLASFIKPPTYEEFQAQLGQAPRAQSSNGSGGQQTRTRVNPFMRSEQQSAA
jgi:hypothetical protein